MGKDEIATTEKSSDFGTSVQGPSDLELERLLAAASNIISEAQMPASTHQTNCDNGTDECDKCRVPKARQDQDRSSHIANKITLENGGDRCGECRVHKIRRDRSRYLHTSDNITLQNGGREDISQFSVKRKQDSLDCTPISVRNTEAGPVAMLGNIKLDITMPKKRKRIAGASLLTSTYEPLQNPLTPAHRKYLQSPSTSPPKAKDSRLNEPSEPHKKHVQRQLPKYKIPSSPLRGPPEVKVRLSSLNSLLTCSICKGYLVNATTLTECLHSFCRSCIIRYAYEKLLCPTCKTLIHPSNPFQNMRIDSTMQDIVHKLLPKIEIDEKTREEKFYTSQGIPYPLIKDNTPEPMKEPEVLSQGLPTWISLLLEHAGTAPTCGPHRTLCKPYVRAPLGATVLHVMNLLALKLIVPTDCKVIVFVDDCLLHESLTLQEVWEMFYEDEVPKPDIMHMQFAVVPDRDFFVDKNYTIEVEEQEEVTYSVSVPMPAPVVEKEYFDDEDLIILS